MEKFNDSLPFDRRLWSEDLQVCPAIAQSLHVPLPLPTRVPVLLVVQSWRCLCWYRVNAVQAFAQDPMACRGQLHTQRRS